MIEELFTKSLSAYESDRLLIDKLWRDIETRYSSASRHYHNLNHLEHLASQLLPVKDDIQEWDVCVFAIAYHDVVYNTLKHNNEEKSADHAVTTLAHLLPNAQLQLLSQFIIATKSHAPNANNDINYFTDADLAILGADEEAYLLYTKQIRKEYRYYPAIVYKGGRQKVVQHFLDMNRIFKTDYFYNKLEAKARMNLENELNRLNG